MFKENIDKFLVMLENTVGQNSYLNFLTYFMT